MTDKNPTFTELPIAQLEENRGQIDGLPANPRTIEPDKLQKLKKSILDNPEMLQLRGIMVYPHEDKYIVIGGNMRLRAMTDLGLTSAPCVIIPSHTTAEKLRAYTILDNSSMGEWDWELLQFNEQTDENEEHPQSCQSMLRKTTISHPIGKRFPSHCERIPNRLGKDSQRDETLF